MKKYRNLISSILSLFLTAFLLAFTIYGWYTSNKVVSTSGISGTVVNTQLIDSAEYFNFAEENVNNNTVTLNINQHNTGNVPMRKYDELASYSTKFLIKINLTETTNVSRVTITSKANYFIGYSETNHSGYVSQTDLNNCLSISSVIEFAYLPASSVTINNTTVSYTKPSTMNEFVYNSTTDGLMTTKQLDLLPSPVETNVVYILLDYNQDYLADFYGNNIGNDILEGDFGEEDSTINFKFDFTIMVV